MQRRTVNYHVTTSFKSCNHSQRGTVIQSAILEIHNFVENNYQSDAIELLKNQKALTQLLAINVCEHIPVVIIACSV